VIPAPFLFLLPSPRFYGERVASVASRVRGEGAACIAPAPHSDPLPASGEREKSKHRPFGQATFAALDAEPDFRHSRPWDTSPQREAAIWKDRS